MNAPGSTLIVHTRSPFTSTPCSVAQRAWPRGALAFCAASLMRFVARRRRRACRAAPNWLINCRAQCIKRILRAAIYYCMHHSDSCDCAAGSCESRLPSRWPSEPLQVRPSRTMLMRRHPTQQTPHHRIHSSAATAAACRRSRLPSRNCPASSLPQHRCDRSRRLCPPTCRAGLQRLFQQ